MSAGFDNMDGNLKGVDLRKRARLLLEKTKGIYLKDVGVERNRVGNFQQKNNFVEDGIDGIDGTNGYFRRNSGCSVEQKILGIPFRTLPRKRKQLGIPFRGRKIEANSRNSLPNPSGEEKQLEIPFRGTKKEANSRNSLPNPSAEEKTTLNFVP
jgi:hypothetical protein